MNHSIEEKCNGDSCFDQAVVTPNQSVQKRRLREWENNTMRSSSAFIMPSMTTPDSSSTLNLQNVHALSFVTQASDSEMDDMDDECTLNSHILSDDHHETKRIRTDIDTLFSSESSYTYKHHPSETQKISNESTEWWRKKSRMEEEVTMSTSNGTRDVRNIHGTSCNECHICRAKTAQTSLPSILQSQSFSSVVSPKRTKQKNSLLSYFNPTKSALSKTFSNTETSHSINRMCSPRVPPPPTCSYCDRVSCANCCKICEQCQSNFCTFCHTVNYESTVEKIMCFNCYESVTVSSNNDMDLS